MEIFTSTETIMKCCRPFIILERKLKTIRATRSESCSSDVADILPSPALSSV